eukprot:3898915-Pyramimonas_sp.AAC.2
MLAQMPLHAAVPAPLSSMTMWAEWGHPWSAKGSHVAATTARAWLRDRQQRPTTCGCSPRRALSGRGAGAMSDCGALSFSASDAATANASVGGPASSPNAQHGNCLADGSRLQLAAAHRTLRRTRCFVRAERGPTANWLRLIIR